MSEYILNKSVIYDSDPNYVFQKYGNMFREIRQQNLPNPTFWFSMLYGVIQADLMYMKEMYAIEFGVYNGDSLEFLCKIANHYTNLFGIKIHVVGFDTFYGLTKLQPVVDHPEIWNEGEFYCIDKNKVLNKCKAAYPNVELIEGDVKETIKSFSFKKECPIGYISVDLDLYTSTKNALPILGEDVEFYLPCVPMYFDDVSTVLTYNPYCGEQLAITEFNNEHEKRKIVKRNDSHLHNFYTCHVLDHPVLAGTKKTKNKFNIFVNL